jgi:hypothetical protein
MSELAFNQNGDLFDVPAVVTGWRVRRLKPRGAPELVYGRDGRPLTISIEADMNELREAVGGVLGKYRLDPISDEGKIAEGTPPAYVQVVKTESHGGEVPAAAVSESDGVIREAMRLNTELAKSVIDRFPEMMHAAAELLRAADGAGLPAREPRATEAADDDEDEDGGDEAPAASSSPAFEMINTLVAQIVPVLVTGLAGKKLPSMAEMLDWRKASPKAKPATEVVPAASAAPIVAPEPQSATAVPPLDPATMAKVIAIQAQLTSEEAARARQLAAELSPAELRAWFEELSALPVPDAVAKIRSLLGGAS